MNTEQRHTLHRARLFRAGTALVVVLILCLIALMGSLGVVTTTFIGVVQLQVFTAVQIILVVGPRLVVVDRRSLTLIVMLIC